MHPRAGKDERDVMPRCRICLKPLEGQYTFVQWLLQEEELCNECLMRLRPEPRHLHLDDLPLTAYYRYDEFMESLLFQFKEGRDVALAPVFFSQVMKQMKRRYRRWQWVLMPSSDERRMTRGFSPLRRMLADSGMMLYEPFYKTDDHKQSSMERIHRTQISTVIRLKEEYPLPSGRVVLIDDVCTTGATLKHAYQLLKEHTIKVEAVTCCAHPLLFETMAQPLRHFAGRRGKDGRHGKMVQ